MQSFHRSRGRILFEVFCALAIAESCVGAWVQTGATAFLPAAAVSALYGIVHAFDMFGRRSKVAAAAASQSTQTVMELEEVVPADKAVVVPTPLAERLLTTANGAEELDKAELAAPRPSKSRRTKAASKGARRRSSAREEAKVAELVLTEESKVAELRPPAEAEVSDSAPPVETKVTELRPPAETKATEPEPSERPPVVAPSMPVEPPVQTSPVPLAPLFAPEPFVRQQRGGFGRKAG